MFTTSSVAAKQNTPSLSASMRSVPSNRRARGVSLPEGTRQSFQLVDMQGEPS
jgi:hypothetical protein